VKQPSHPIHTPAPGANRHLDWQIVHSVFVVVVLGIFLYTVRGILSPFLAFLLLLFVIAPLQGTRLYVLIVSAATMLTMIWALNATGFLLAPFLLALAFAYIQNPLVTRMERRKISRTWGTLIMAIPTLVILGLLFFVGLPALGGQIADFINNSPQYLQRATVWVEGLQAQVMRRDIPGRGRAGARDAPARDQAGAAGGVPPAAPVGHRGAAWAGVLGLGAASGTDPEHPQLHLPDPHPHLLPPARLAQDHGKAGGDGPGPAPSRVLAFAREYDRLLYGFLRGNVTSSAVVGFLTFLGLFLLGFPYALLLGIMAAVFNIIPYVGLVLTLIPALVIALFTPDPVVGLGKALGVFVAVQLLDGAVLSPNIVGESVNLHPVWVILALSVFGFFFGFVGLLLAVPLAVLLKLVLTHALVRYRRSRLYLGDERAMPMS
jgi:predicted PurR-regulated permease PerM